MKLYDLLTVMPETETIRLVKWEGTKREKMGYYMKYYVPDHLLDFNVVSVFGLDFGVTFVSIIEKGREIYE